MFRRTLPLAISTLLLMFALLPSGVLAAPRPIQDQGRTPYCLFAVNAYLARADMWELAATYHSRRLPTWDGITPYNENILQLARELYGADWHIWGQGDWWAARWGVTMGFPTAYTGQGHAIVVIEFRDGRAYYLDSLHAGEVLSMSEAELQQWWDGWAWLNKGLNGVE